MCAARILGIHEQLRAAKILGLREQLCIQKTHQQLRVAEQHKWKKPPLLQ